MCHEMGKVVNPWEDRMLDSLASTSTRWTPGVDSSCREISRRVERGGHLSPNTEGCIAPVDAGEFARQSDERLDRARRGSVERQQVRYWAANSSDVEFDKQGRFALPTAIREYGQLSGDVLIVGTLDHIELWNPAIYAEKVNSARAF